MKNSEILSTKLCYDIESQFNKIINDLIIYKNSNKISCYDEIDDIYGI
jgi:hypothetical protein